jgi:hypothetical protein
MERMGRVLGLTETMPPP